MANGEWWLLVDDGDADRQMAAAVASMYNVDTYELVDGYQALEWVRTVDRQEYDGSMPTVAIIEVRTPGPRGNEISKYMRRLTAFDQTCIILTSSYEFPDDDKQDLKAISGADLFVVKPLPTLALLEALIRKAIDKKRAEQHISKYSDFE